LCSIQLFSAPVSHDPETLAVLSNDLQAPGNGPTPTSVLDVSATGAQPTTDANTYASLLKTRIAGLDISSLALHLSGTLTLTKSNNTQTIDLVQVGLAQWRLSRQTPSGTVITVRNGTVEAVTDEAGKTKALHSHRLATRNVIVPGLTILQDVGTPGFTAGLTNNPDGTARLAITPPLTTPEKNLRLDKSVVFEVSATGQVDAVEFNLYPEAGGNQTVRVRVEYGNYLVQNGLAIPRQVTTFWNQQQQSILTIAAIDFSPTITPGLFDITFGGGL
jgi:hypothetical protein